MQTIANGRTTLDGSGNGSVVLGPVPAWERWTLARIVVSTSDTGAAVPTCVVYHGTAEGGRRLDATYTGNSDTSDFSTPIELAAGYFLTVVWADGNPADEAVAELYGSRARGL